MRNATKQRDLNIESLDDFITRIAERMFARVDMSGFSHLRELAPALERGHRGKAYPRELLQSESDATANIVAVGVATPLFPPPKFLHSSYYRPPIRRTCCGPHPEAAAG